MANGIIQVREHGARNTSGKRTWPKEYYRWYSMAQGILQVEEYGSRNTQVGEHGSRNDKGRRT